uniref:Dolichol phosphate-mannose biosynthesis regulatory protein n=2 Tax=Eukaryota TaxID=2759 RepID=A0A7S1HRD3_9EUKA|mmetsp:Transcript_13050/g.33765  ORF Transcript_13050/g.33765 Transcript_13050/m.33765 type:complete len:132 (+) Transcript_13050:191-586(+)
MVDGPSLAPLIATTRANGKAGSGGGGNTQLLLQPFPAFISGVAVLFATLLFFYKEIVYLEEVMASFPPAFLLLPVSGIGALALVLPMFVFLCFRDDFVNTNIIFPSHYLYVFKRTYGSVLRNNGKVSKKTI